MRYWIDRITKIVILKGDELYDINKIIDAVNLKWEEMNYKIIESFFSEDKMPEEQYHEITKKKANEIIKLWREKNNSNKRAYAYRNRNND